MAVTPAMRKGGMLQASLGSGRFWENRSREGLVRTETVGSYLATRLEQIGIRDYFAVPGDYNLVLLDQMLANENMRMVGCCNELNLGYALDGYARGRGLAAGFVTFSVGGLSAINAIAGCYAEDLGVILVSGGPHTDATVENRLLHHTLGEVRYDYQREMYRHVTAEAVSIVHLDDAAHQIDEAIGACLERHKPVYIEVASNLAGLPIPAASGQHRIVEPWCDTIALDEAVEQAAAMFDQAAKPVLVAGVKMRPSGAIDSFRRLAEAIGCAVAVMPNAKGLFPEDHPQYIGVYWGPVSTPGTANTVDSADAYLHAGSVFTDYTTTGYTAAIQESRLLRADPNRVTLPGRAYNDVPLDRFLDALAGRVEPNPVSLQAFERFRPAPAVPDEDDGGRPLLMRRVLEKVEAMVGPDTTLLVETGDSWFNGIKMHLPDGARFEIQMQYGSIGWSVGATLGLAMAEQGRRRIISMIGDGSFQMGAQELSTMLRYGADPIIFLINNGGYTIEVEIHDGPYNEIHNWDYAALAGALSAGGGSAFSTRATNEGELDAAIAGALAHRDGPSLIELIIDRDDCSPELLEWGSHVAVANGRPPAYTR